jgi:hypothetical protein
MVPRESSLALFGAFASAEKTLYANAGGHLDVPKFEVESSVPCFARHLLGGRERLPSIRGLGMAGARVGDPGGSSLVIDQVPDTPATGYLVLPPLQRFTLPYGRAQTALQAVMTFR